MNKRKPADKSSCSCTSLRKASRRLSLIYDAALAPTGLKITQRAILAEIGRSMPCAVGALAEALVMDAGALAHTLKPLERDGYICSTANPDDRRHRLINLTSQGRAKLVESEKLWTQTQTAFEAAVGKAETKALHIALARLSDPDFLATFEEKLAATSKE